MKIVFFDAELEGFIFSLQKGTIAKVLRTIDLLERFGVRLGMPHSKKIYRDVFELRVRGVQEVRIFYAIRKDEAVLLHAFIKKSKKIPKRELETAISRFRLLA